MKASYLDFMAVHGFVYTAVVVLGPIDRLEVVRQQQQGGQDASSRLPASLMGSKGCSKGKHRFIPSVATNITASG
jgi:hypothetical protein